MSISIFDLFKIGIGPSSSHTVGPMVAANTFFEGLKKSDLLGAVDSISVDLYGSLGATGKGHGSGKAILLGLMGEKPDAVDVNKVPDIFNKVIVSKKIQLGGLTTIDFDYDVDITFHRKKTLPFHPNGMMITAYNANQAVVLEKIYYSVGGGFVIDDSERDQAQPPIKKNARVLPYPFNTGDELLALCEKEQLSISEIMLRNECICLSEADVRQKLLEIWNVMQECVDAGCKNTGILPGGLKVKRRAAELFHSLENELTHEQYNQGSMDWVNLYALAVNEENAAGGRVVTAPTNGAAGIIPALIHYYVNFCRAYKHDGEEGIIRLLLTAAAIGIIIKENASISGAEVGCQGEIGSACAMAAAGLTEVLGGTPKQVENAAEIGIEHNLGLTCDPIGGLVQIPCIERNAMGAVKAINASRMSLRGSGEHYVSLDKAIATMRETGKDMRSKYKETSRGGLAVQLIEVPVNIVEC